MASSIAMKDYFFFSNVTRGILIANDLELGLEKDFYLSTIFKVHDDELTKQHMKESGHERVKNMTLFSFKAIEGQSPMTLEDNYPGK